MVERADLAGLGPHPIRQDEWQLDKHIWQLPIPLYDPTDDYHSRLSARGV